MLVNSFIAASAALTFVSLAHAETFPRGAHPIQKRTQGPSQPSCTDFTPFQYAGCFVDVNSPERTLEFSGPSTNNVRKLLQHSNLLLML
jgi:hypothetical protein